MGYRKRRRNREARVRVAFQLADEAMREREPGATGPIVVSGDEVEARLAQRRADMRGKK